MLGRDDEYVDGAGARPPRAPARRRRSRAARCAFWIGDQPELRGETAGAAGWFGRARRLVEREPARVRRAGLPAARPDVRARRPATTTPRSPPAPRPSAIGERFGDADLFALAAQDEGILLIVRGRVAEGLALLDEAMVAVTAGELSPIVNGFVYCGVITGCQAAYEPRRAQEWTAALTRWCEAQPDMVSFTGTCLRAPRRDHAAPRRLARGARRGAPRARALRAGGERRRRRGQALYRQGELHRLRGGSTPPRPPIARRAAAGCEPQPGLALLRLAQGDGAAAGGRDPAPARPRRPSPPARAGAAPRRVEILLAAGDVAAARAACRELERDRRALGRRLLGALAAPRARRGRAGGGRRARGARRRCGGRRGPGASSRRPTRRRARACWSGEACAALGDADTAALELDAARDGLRAARRGAGPRARRRARGGATARHARPDRARAGGAAAGRGRAEQPRDRRPRS